MCAIHLVVHSLFVIFFLDGQNHDLVPPLAALRDGLGLMMSIGACPGFKLGPHICQVYLVWKSGGTLIINVNEMRECGGLWSER